MVKIRLAAVFIHLLGVVTGNPQPTTRLQDRLQSQGFQKAFLFNSSTTLTLPIGSYMMRVLVVGGGGGGCYSDNKGRGNAGQVIVQVFTMSINQTRTETVIVGKGSEEVKLHQAGQPAGRKAESKIFGFTAKGGATCRPNIKEYERKSFEPFFISRISYGSAGNNSRPSLGARIVQGGQGGILINSTGPTAQRGAKPYSSEGGVGYGAGGGSGGKYKIKIKEAESTGGKGAPGVVYVEVLPKVCQKPVRVVFALDASANISYQGQTIYNLIRDFFTLSKDLVEVSLIVNSSSIVTIDQMNVQNVLRAKAVLSLGQLAAATSKVDIEQLLFSALKAFGGSNDDKVSKTLVIFTSEEKVHMTDKMNASKEELRRMGVKILVVGLAKYSTLREELQKLSFKADYVFVERRTNDLVNGNMMSAMANLICRASLHYPSLLTTTTTLSPPTRPESYSEKLQKEYEYILNYNITESDPNDSSTVKRVMTIAGDLIRNSNKLPNSTKTAPGLKVLQFLEDYGLNMATKLDIEPHKNRSYKHFGHGRIDMVIFSYKISSVEQLTLPQFSSITNTGRVKLPKEAFGGSGRGSVVWLTVNPVMSMVQDNNSVITSKIMMLNVQPKAKHTFERPVELTFTINKVNQDRQQRSCEFWDSSKRSISSLHGAWSSEGCSVTRENKTSVSCHCNHLTSFAVLTRILPKEDSSGVHEKYLSIITYIGCSLSILGCILTIVIHACLPSLRTERTFIHLNLVTAILIAQCLFFIAASIRGPKGLCFAVAVFLYLFYLCVFTWMLVEGLHIYCLVIRVFHSGHERKRLYAVIGWVVPLIITIIAAASFREDFVAHNICWLSTESGAIWAFVGPALVIIAINLVILVLVLKVTATVMIKDETQNNTNKSLVKACITLLPILGLTWLFGILAINKKTVVFEYLFCICNSFQGLLIFFFYCIGSSEVRRECKRKLHNYETKRSLRNSSTGSKPNKQNNSNGGKATRSAELISQRDVNDDTRL